MFKHLVYVTVRDQNGTDIQIYQIIWQENAYTALLPDPRLSQENRLMEGLGQNADCASINLLYLFYV